MGVSIPTLRDACTRHRIPDCSPPTGAKPGSESVLRSPWSKCNVGRLMPIQASRTILGMGSQETPGTPPSCIKKFYTEAELSAI